MIKNLKGSIMLLIATIIWGSAFVAQESASRYIGSFTINCLRSLIAVAVLIPTAYIFKFNRQKTQATKEKLFTKTTVFAGIICGLALSVAANLQQFGIMFNSELREGSSDKAGFLTAMYLIFVPLFSCFIGKKLQFSMLVGVVLSVFGLYFISISENFSISAGDISLLLCAVAFALHIMIVDGFVSKVDGIALSAVQFLTVAVTSGILMLIFERNYITVQNLTSAALPVIFCGVLSSGIAYTLQIIGQKNCEPTIASIIMSLESLFCLITASIFNKSSPTLRMMLGCLLMLTAILVIETPFTDRMFAKIFKRKKSYEI